MKRQTIQSHAKFNLYKDHVRAGQKVITCCIHNYNLAWQLQASERGEREEEGGFNPRCLDLISRHFN